MVAGDREKIFCGDRFFIEKKIQKRRRVFFFFFSHAGWVDTRERDVLRPEMTLSQNERVGMLSCYSIRTSRTISCLLPLYLLSRSCVFVIYIRVKVAIIENNKQES